VLKESPTSLFQLCFVNSKYLGVKQPIHENDVDNSYGLSKIFEEVFLILNKEISSESSI
jgi:hypothetical protein